MIIYIDQIIISNLLVNYLFIKLISLLYKEKILWYRTSIALLVSLISLSLFFISIKYIYNLRYFVGILIGFIAFYKKRSINWILEIVIYYLLNMSFVGTLAIFNIKSAWIFILSLMLVIVLWILENFKVVFMKSKQYEYNVKINNKKYTGYLDSGNKTYYEGIPVVFIKNNYQCSDYKLYGSMIVNGINNSSILDIYIGPMLIIKDKEYYVYYSFIESPKYDIILNYELGD